MSKLLAAAISMLLALAALTPATAEEPEEEVVEEEVVYEDLAYYFHGNEALGELELGKLGHFKMNSEEPTGSEMKSIAVVNYVGGPNTKCSGNWLLPTWQGNLDGTVVGDVTVTLHSIAGPGGTVNVQLFADGGGGCNDAYVPPVASQEITLPVVAGETEVVFSDLNFNVDDHIIVMVHGVAAGQGRIAYDSTTTASSIQFSCLPRVVDGTCVW